MQGFGYLICMVSMPLPMDPSRRKRLQLALSGVLTPAQLSMASVLVATEKPGMPDPTPEQLLHWMRLNMPVAAARIEAILHPHE